ncbi:hypothetical protein Q0F99_08685 [Rathayibacter oskolensis]|uniref:hypothetical protein n=1 Tax=Rathayibacter oskolensis TaxID=1891671 RepID=UPI00265F2918|nr:hypothetical protein [Rathayibacter oskolensis]WKK72930.1 hypothetical protein Q0F99_08685 [Rathayibacter oskolensis]
MCAASRDSRGRLRSAGMGTDVRTASQSTGYRIRVTWSTIHGGRWSFSARSIARFCSGVSGTWLTGSARLRGFRKNEYEREISTNRPSAMV